MSEQIKFNVYNALFGFFSVKLDETADIENNSQMSVFIWWVDGAKMREDIFMNKKN